MRPHALRRRSSLVSKEPILRRAILLALASSAILAGAVALAQSPDPKDAKITQAIDLLNEALAIPPVTVTETITATVTETVTPAPTTTPPPPAACQGVTVAPGSGLKAAVDAAPDGTTFCLQAGTYTVANTITVNGDTIIGAGRDATFIDMTSMDPNHSHGFYTGSGLNTFRNFEVFGARTPTTVGTCFTRNGDQSNSACGKAFTNWGLGSRLFNIDCHDNGGNCVGGSGDLIMDNVDCYNNGSNYSMNASFRYAACVKQATANVDGINDVTITNSNIHDNPWVGVWCDFCKFGAWDIHNNTFVRNGVRGIQWEMSGGWSAGDQAHIYDNVFTGNGFDTADPAGVTVGARGGIDISTADDILVENNSFDGHAEVSAQAVWIVFTASRNPPSDASGVIVRNNILNGDGLSGCGVGGSTCYGNV